MGLILTGLTLGALYNLYNTYNGNASKYGDRASRIRAARNNLLPEERAFSSVKKSTKTVADDNANWKGATRKKFDNDMNFLMNEMDARADKLDNYCDMLNTAASNADRKSGSYLPLISEVRTAIQNFGNLES